MPMIARAGVATTMTHAEARLRLAGQVAARVWPIDDGAQRRVARRLNMRREGRRWLRQMA